jgi:hypothetical protein
VTSALSAPAIAPRLSLMLSTSSSTARQQAPCEVSLNEVPASFRLMPGMTLTADINVGSRSVFMYLLRGVIRGVHEAMREP